MLAARRPHVVIQAISSVDSDAARGQLLTVLRQRVHVVTATKSALVRGLDGLLASARASGCQLRYSAATAAALPTVDLIDTALRGTAITRIQGSSLSPAPFSRAGAATVDIDAVEIEGLTPDMESELAAARRAGQVVRLLGRAEFGDGFRICPSARSAWTPDTPGCSEREGQRDRFSHRYDG